MSENAPKSRSLTRRRFLKIAGLGVAAVVAGSVVDAEWIEPRWIDVTSRDIRLARLAPGWAGARVAHLTDLHAGPLMPIDRVRRVVDLTLAQSPDLIVLTGDAVTGASLLGGELVAELSRLRAPMGSFASLGNHDYGAGTVRVTDLLREAGFTLLVNAHATLDRAGDRLVLAGVDDLWRGRPDLDAALAGADDEPPRVLLCHNPDFADQMPEFPRVDFMLSGHTHGGQIRLPFVGPLHLPVRNRAYASGLAQGPRCPVFISRGLAGMGTSSRFLCRPEIALLTLRPV